MADIADITAAGHDRVVPGYATRQRQTIARCLTDYAEFITVQDPNAELCRVAYSPSASARITAPADPSRAARNPVPAHRCSRSGSPAFAAA
jgi:hypothetical protein